MEWTSWGRVEDACRMKPVSLIKWGLVALIYTGTILVYSHIVSERDQEISRLKNQVSEASGRLADISEEHKKVSRKIDRLMDNALGLEPSTWTNRDHGSEPFSEPRDSMLHGMLSQAVVSSKLTKRVCALSVELAKHVPLDEKWVDSLMLTHWQAMFVYAEEESIDRIYDGIINSPHANAKRVEMMKSQREMLSKNIFEIRKLIEQMPPETRPPNAQ